MDTYTMRCRSVGNPDYGQYVAVSRPEVITATSLQGIRAKARAYIVRWALGGGNWPNCAVLKDGKKFALMSYNGRFWTTQKQWEDRKEIVINGEGA